MQARKLNPHKNYHTGYFFLVVSGNLAKHFLQTWKLCTWRVSVSVFLHLVQVRILFLAISHSPLYLLLLLLRHLSTCHLILIVLPVSWNVLQQFRRYVCL